MGSDIDTALNLRIEASLAKLERQLDKGRRKSRSTALGMQGDFDRMNGRISKSARASAAVIERAISKAENNYASLARSINPAEHATLELARAEKVLDDALKRGVITASKHKEMIGLARREYELATQSMASGSAKAAGGLTGLLNVNRGARATLQNTSFQLADIAVQAEMGVDPMRILAQQGSQVAGSFASINGPVGLLVPILGTLLAVGAPVIAMLMNMGDESEEAEEKIKTFADALDAAEAAISRADAAAKRASQGGVEDLEAIYGNATEKVRELALALADIELRAAKLDMNQLLDFTLNDKYRNQVEKMFGVVGAAIASSGSAEAQEQIEALKEGIRDLNAEIEVMSSRGGIVPASYTDQLAEMEAELAALEGRVGDIGVLADELGVSPEVLKSYSELETRLTAAREAGDFAEIADALSEMRGILEAAGDQIDQEIKDGLAHAESEARKMAKAVQDVKDATSDVAAASDSLTFDRGIRGAAAMADEVLRAVRAMYELQSAGGGELKRAQLRYKHRKDPVALAGALAGEKFDRETGALRDAGFDNAGEEAFYNQQRKDRIAEAMEIARLQEATRGDGRSSSGSGSSTNGSDFMATAERELEVMKQRIEMIGKSKAEIAGLNLKYRLLEAAKEKGIDLDRELDSSGRTLRQTIDQKAKSLEELAEAYEQANEKQAFFDEQSRDIKDGLLDAIIEGENFADTLDQVGKAFKRAALEALLFNEGAFASGGGGGLLGGIFDGLFGGGKSADVIPNANGNAFSKGRVVPFANGTVVSSPTYFPMAGNETGLMGEAGPEAIMPLTRVGGKLGVRSAGGGAGRAVVRIEAPEGFTATQVSQSREIAVDVATSAVESYDQRLPDRHAEMHADPMVR